jgi:Ca2+:H+ antiporter
MAVATSPRVALAWQVLPVVGIAVLAATWGRDIGLPVVVLVAILLAGGVLAAVHHAEVVAHRVGEPFGSLVLAVAVTVIEVALIVTLMLSGGDEAATLARETVFAAVMITVNGILGLSLLLGSRRFGTVRFNAEGTGGALATVATLATVCLVLPTVTLGEPGPEFTPAQLAFAAVASLALYLAFVVTQTVRHRDFFLPVSRKGVTLTEDDHADPPTDREAYTSLGFLLLSLVAVVGLAKIESPAIEDGVLAAGLPISFVGVVIALLVLLPETLAGDDRGGERRPPRPHPDLAQPRDGVGDGLDRPDDPDAGRGVDLDRDPAEARAGAHPDRAPRDHGRRRGADRRAGPGHAAAGERAPDALRGVPLPRDVPLTQGRREPSTQKYVGRTACGAQGSP